MNGTFTLHGSPFQSTWTEQRRRPLNIRLHVGTQLERQTRFQIWAIPTSLAATKGIPVGFFSSAY